MSIFCCVAKTEAKTKTNVFLQIDVPKKASLLSSLIEHCSTKLDSSSCSTAVVFLNSAIFLTLGRYFMLPGFP